MRGEARTASSYRNTPRPFGEVARNIQEAHSVGEVGVRFFVFPWAQLRCSVGTIEVMDDLTIRARLLNGISGPAKEAKRDVEALAKASKQTKSFTDDLVKAQSKSGNIFGRTHLDHFKTSATGMKAVFTGLASEAGRLGQSIMRSIGGLATSAFHKATSAAKTLLKALATGAFAAASFGVKSYGELEAQQVAFGTLLGSSQKAAALIDNMKSFAKVTPFRFGDVADSAKLLLAGGWKENQLIPTLRKVGDAAAAVSVPIDRVLMQITQMQATKAMNWADMRILSQTGLPVLDILGEKLGKTGQQVREIMSAPGGGAWLAQQDGIQKLIDGLGERYQGMMDAQSRTMKGLWSTVADTFSLGLGDTMKPIVDTFIKPWMTSAIPKVEKGLKRTQLLFEAAAKGYKKYRDAPIRPGDNSMASTSSLETGGRRTAQEGGIRGALGAIDQMLGPSSRLRDMWIDLEPKIVAVWDAAKKLAGLTWDALTTAFEVIKTGIKFVADHKEAFVSLGIAIGALTPVIIALGAAMWLASLNPLTLVLGAMLVAVIGVAWGVTFLIRNWNRFSPMTKQIVGVILGIAGALLLLAVAAAVNPLTWIILGVMIFVGVLILVASKWRSIWDWMKKNKAMAGLAISAIIAIGTIVISTAPIAAVATAIGAVTTAAGVAATAIATMALGAAVGIAAGYGAAKVLDGLAAKESAKNWAALTPSQRTATQREVGNTKTATFNGKPADPKKINDMLSGPRVRMRGYQSHGRPVSTQGLRITSGYRTHSLGSFNSAHKAGNALDLVGSGLNRYASKLTDAGGFAQFHGAGPNRHLHAEHPYPVGDTSAPRITPGRAQTQAPAEPVIINIHPMAHHSPADIAQMVKNAMNDRDRSRRERGSGR